MYNNISNDEKRRILELHSKPKNLIFEAMGEGVTNSAPGQTKFTFNNVKTLGVNLFETGSDKINTNSNEFKEALKLFKSFSAGTTVEIQGGASKVGDERGYDNEALANRRANNFVQALKNNGITGINFTIIAPVVGGSNVRNSKEALDAQFVKFAYDTPSAIPTSTTAIDNTATERLPDVEMASGDSVFRIKYDPNTIDFETIKKNIVQCLRGKVTSMSGRVLGRERS